MEQRVIELEHRVMVLEKEIAELKGQVSVRPENPIPGSVLWFQKIASEISGVNKIEINRLENGVIELGIVLVENNSIKTIEKEFEERLSIKSLTIPFRCKLKFLNAALKVVSEIWIDRGSTII